jgi:hypothetical protein
MFFISQNNYWIADEHGGSPDGSSRSILLKKGNHGSTSCLEIYQVLPQRAISREFIPPPAGGNKESAAQNWAALATGILNRIHFNLISSPAG